MALALLGLLAGCAHVTPECATHAGTPWTELTSQHFVVSTNLQGDEARAAAVLLERARAAMLPAFPSGPPSPPLEVIVFSSATQLQELSGDPLLDAALMHDWQGALLLTGNTASILESTPQLQSLLHELSHHFSAGALKRWPRWLEEGLSTYLETVTIDAEAKVALRGRAHQLKLGEVMRWGILPVQSLWAWDEEPDAHNGLEAHRLASAWFWVHFLFNEQRPAMGRFLRSLGEGVEPREAWAAAFGTLAPQAMADAADAYIARGQAKSQRIELAQLNTALVERALPDAQAHALLARVAAVTGAWPRARAEAAEAMALDGHDARAVEQLVVTQESVERRIAEARQLTELHPSRGSGWLLLALSLPAADAERGQALERALELQPDSFLALSELAKVRCAQGRCPEGVALAERAVGLAPGDPRVQAGAASVLRQAGQCEKAVAMQHRAMEVLSHRAPPALRAQLQQRLVEYQQCAR